MLRIANAPCSWGVLEFDLEGISAPYERVLGEMKSAGYQGTEFGDWGFLPTDPNTLKGTARQYGLDIMAAFVPVALRNPDTHAEGIETALRTARLLNAVHENPFIVLADDNGSDPSRTNNAGRIQPDQGMDAPEWDTFAGGAENLARRVLDETGVRTVFHFHCGGFIETPGEIDQLMERTNPDVLGLCFDTGHYTYGGGDAVAGLEKYADRIWHVHYKDCDPRVAETARTQQQNYFQAVEAGVFCCLGDGMVDFPALSQRLKSNGYDGWIVVEQDVFPGMGSPTENAIANRNYLYGLGL